MKTFLMIAVLLVPAGSPAQDTPEVHLPAFTFRTMDHKNVTVQLNGADYSTTPCLWSVTRNLQFMKPPLPAAWPPEGGRFVASSQHPDDPASKAEVYVLSDPDVLKKIPNLRKGECVLAVKGSLGGTAVQGGLLLYVPGYRWTNYTPLADAEGEDASRFLRTLWFERISDE